MSRTLHVWLYGEHVADAERASDGTLSLRYGERGHDVSTSMSSLVERHGHAHVAPWLAGLLPDNTAVLSRWATEFQVAPTPFALLGTAIGLDCAGAVQFTPGGVPLPVRRDSGVEWLDEDQLARVGEALYRDRTAWGGSRGTGRFSLAGAQSKVALRFEDGRYGQPFGDEPTNVIAKPSLPGFEGHDLNEHLCLDAARRCGVVAPPSWVERFGARRLVVVVRYDRRRERDGTWRRVHQEDLCQALGLPPERKYQSDGGPTPRDIAERLRAVVEPRAAVEDVQQFADALLFNWLVVGTDAHAKNYSLLLPAGGRVRLAPRYDLGSMIPYEDPLACKLAMKLGGEYRIKAISAGVHLPVLASHLGDDAERLRLRAAGLARALPDALADAAREAGALDDPVAIALRDGVSAHTRRLFPAPRTGGS